ncbi:hypothetical protein QP810_10025 [Streptococcus agalactiae]|uniref:hypothetical protein n=1 Tax=Streptococcus agalactiae TaxID=1311 RepID=UPI002555CFA0|nr:hypothetical protein [Streptococcus agalactiae]MDK8747561.1 hypothetical protein [Streptococcus agalactiae]
MKELVQLLKRFCDLYKITPKIEADGSLEIGNLVKEAKHKGVLTEEKYREIIEILNAN